MARKYLAVDTSAPDYSLIEGTFFNKFDCYTEFVNAIESVIPNLFEYKILSQRNGQSPRREVLIECKFKNENYSSTPFYFYVCPIEGGGRFENEQRIQFNPSNRWTPNLSALNKAHQFLNNEDKTGLEIYVLGIYKPSEHDNNIVFSGLYPSSIETTETDNNKTSTSSVQIRIESIQRAYQTGIDFESTNASPIINFTPNNLFWYMINRDKLHLADLEKLSEIINSHKNAHPSNPNINITEISCIIFQDYLRAMRTKPFLLLAGISGTGKSRIVKQMAFDSCPNIPELRKDPTSPGNYCLIEVKPNWHDSTELLGYESKIGGDHYVLTPFVKFLAKAKLYPDVPFFVCLDEMNLAPVEQYFAEFLSVLESRTKIDGHIVSEPLIKSSIFANSKYANDLKHDIFNIGIRERQADGVTLYDADLSAAEEKVYQTLTEEGLRIPENVVIIGTVNMDETTHQFSRKVIDRAMTIEMNLPEGTDEEGNEINPFKAFFDNSSELAYREEPTSPLLYLATETKAADVINHLSEINPERSEELKDMVAEFLIGLNTNLEGTPFKVAYRVQNELLLYFYQLLLENKEADWQQIFTTTADQILMMKVLPRIEGDEELLEKPLERLISFCEPYRHASKKLNEMKSRLSQSRFTSFWP